MHPYININVYIYMKVESGSGSVDLKRERVLLAGLLEGKGCLPPKKGVCLRYGTQLHPVFRLKFSRFAESGVSLHHHYFQVHFQPDCLYQ